MKKSATSNYAGFISIDKPTKKISPSIKSSKHPNPSPGESRSTPRRNGEGVQPSSGTTTLTRKSTGRAEVQVGRAKVSNSSSTSKSKTKEHSSTNERTPTLIQEKTKTNIKDIRKDSTNQRKSKDISFVDETKTRFKAINENLVNKEELMKNKNSDKTSEKRYLDKRKSELNFSHTEQFEKSLIMTEPRVEPLSSGSVSATKTGADKEDNYEDDFEDYESDFESFSSSLEDVSSGSHEEVERPTSDTTPTNSNQNFLKVKNVEEEKKLDSGVYELTLEERRQRGEMQNIRRAIDEENASVLSRLQGSQEENVDDSSLDLSNRFEFINFEEALNLENKKKKSAKTKKRSDYLLDMIKLDQISCVIYDSPPIVYEAYIKCYGRSNAQQVFVQTNDDNLNEETQTDTTTTSTKWTQCPISFNLSNAETLQQLRSECSGVGMDNPDSLGDVRSEGFKSRLLENNSSLNKFVEKIGQIALSILEEDLQYSDQNSDQIFQSDIFENNTRNLKFSDQFINLRVDHVPFLANRPISHAQFCRRSDLKLITVHQKGTSKVSSEMLGRCMLCQWNICTPSSPLVLLVANSDVTCLECEDPSMVFAGMKDGSLSLWDLRDKPLNVRLGEINLRPPSYNTATILNQGMDQCNEVVSIQMVHEDNNIAREPSQILSLDQNGNINIWTIFRSAIASQTSKQLGIVDLGQSCWGSVRLVFLKAVRRNQMSRFSDMEYTCMTILNEEIFVGTTSGLVQHLSMTSSSCMPVSYVSNTDEQLVVNCIEHCPYESDYFLVGYSNGQIKMYNRKREKPLISFAGTGNPGALSVDVRFICWSKHRLGLFFVLDSDARLHMWDLCKSDMYPLYSIALQSAQVVNFDLSPNCLGSVQSSFLVFGTSSSRVEVHKIKKELGKQTDVELKKDKSKFIKYVSIL